MKAILGFLRRDVPADRAILIVAMAMGVWGRLFQYLNNRSLWYDEAYIALRIIGPRFWKILAEGEYVQTMPPGLIAAFRLLVELFGPGELVLRFIPAVLGIASVFLMVPIARRCLHPAAVAPAVALFALATRPLLMAATAKQYSPDIFFALVLYAAALRLRIGRWRIGGPVFLPLFGAAVIWLSHPSVFILAGIGAIDLWRAVRRRTILPLRRHVVAYLAWAASFGLFYWFSVSPMVKSASLLRDWGYSNSFMPVREGIVKVAFWLGDRFQHLFVVNVGTPFQLAVGFVFIWGYFSLRQRNRHAMMLLVLPIVLAAFASALRKYAFHDRLLCFLAPAVAMVVGEGLVFISAVVNRKLALIVAALVFFSPVCSAYYYLFKPYRQEEVRPILEYVQKNLKDDDWIYLYYGVQPAYDYYAGTERVQVDSRQLIRGVRSRRDRSAYDIDVKSALWGKKRVWFVFSHVYPMSEGLYIQDILKRYAKVIEQRNENGSYCWLVEPTKKVMEEGS